MAEKISSLLDQALTKASNLERQRKYNVRNHTINTLFYGIMQCCNCSIEKCAKEVEQLNAKVASWGKEANQLGWDLRAKLPNKIDVEYEDNQYDKLKSLLPSDKVLNTLIVLEAILKMPTAEIKEVLYGVNFNEIKEEKVEVKKEEKVEVKKEDGQKANFVPKVIQNQKNKNKAVEDILKLINKTKANLLEKIYGQDHAVNALTDALWNAEITALSDDSRKRPKGVLLFAGPAGVGKTFMAESLAEEMNYSFARFDMSEYASRDSNLTFAGFDKTFKDSQEGVVTGFVRKNPKSILLFDEIEKAHINVIHLFLQILDAGAIRDTFHNESVSFKDTIIIFTSNAGKELYENRDQIEANISEDKLVGALRADKNLETGGNLFPESILSRLSSNYIIMFNNLSVSDLERVCRAEFDKSAAQLEKVFGVDIEADDDVISSILFASGGKGDARSLKGKTSRFVKKELRKLLGLYNEGNAMLALQKINKIHFCVDLSNESEDICSFYGKKSGGQILYYGLMDALPTRVKNTLTDFKLHFADDLDEAYRIIERYDVDTIIMEIDSDVEDFKYDENKNIVNNKTVDFFDLVPVGASDLSARRNDLKALHKAYPQLPIYIKETGFFTIDKALETALKEDGAKGIVKLVESRGSGSIASFLKTIGEEVYIQNKIKQLKQLSKMISFETTPGYDADKQEINIRLRNFKLEQIIDLEDEKDVVCEVEDIDVCFDDVIGAANAKKELEFFVEYLKNPKAYLAQGFARPKGVLLYGDPGTGKTMLAKAAAKEAGVAFIQTEASSFVNKYVGSGPQAVRDLFKKARKYAPAIIFIDEIDAIGKQRTGNDFTQAQEETLATLLTEMDGFKVDKNRPVFVLAATNYDVNSENARRVIDPALARRFDRTICVDLPNKDERAEYLEKQLDKLNADMSTNEIKDFADYITLFNSQNVKHY